MSFIDGIRKVAALIEPAFSVLELIQSVSGVGGDKAADALKVIDAAVKSFAAAADGTISVAEAQARIDGLRASLAANDLAADAALAARFPEG